MTDPKHRASDDRPSVDETGANETGANETGGERTTATGPIATGPLPTGRGADILAGLGLGVGHLSSVRTVPLPQVVADALAAHPAGPDGLIFTSSTGSPVNKGISGQRGSGRHERQASKERASTRCAITTPRR